jgi:hypothetical protein
VILTAHKPVSNQALHEDADKSHKPVLEVQILGEDFEWAQARQT